MPNFSDLAKQGIRFRTLDTAQQEQPAEEQGNFSRGFEKAMLQVPQTLGGTMALAGDLTGIDGLKEYGLGVYQHNSDKIGAITKDADSLSNVLDGDASAGDWLANNSGYVAGQALQAVATGGVGGFIGSQLAKRGIAGVVARGAESLAARQVAQKVASRGAKVGAATALFGSNLSQEAGSIYPEALHVAETEGRELDGQDKARVVGSAVAAAGVDTAMDALMLGRVMSGARRGGEGVVKAGMREIPLAGLREGVTEGIQTGIERYGAGQDLSTADAIRDYVDSVGVGVLGGGMGGAASIIRSQKVPESGPLTRAANTSIEQQVMQLEYDPQPLISFPDGSVGHKQDLQAYLLQFPEGEERTRREREIMGRDPETGKRIKPEPAPEPTSANNAEAEASNLQAWGARHEGVPLDYAQSLIAAPGAKGMDLMIVPHPKGTDYTVIPSKWLTLDTQAKYGALQKGDEGMLPGPDREAPSGAIRVDSEGGAARETYGEQVRTAREARDQATADALLAQRERDMGKPVPNGARTTPAAGPIPTLTDELAPADGIPVLDDVLAPADGIPVLTDIITAPSGNPFKSEFAAKRRMAEGGYAETHDLLPVDGGFILQPKTEVTNANDAVLAQDDGATGGPSGAVADPAGSGEAIGPGAAAVLAGERGAADIAAGEAVQPADVRATGSADANAALNDPGAREQVARDTLRELGKISNEVMGGNHPSAVDLGTVDGSFAGLGTLDMDEQGNIVLRRKANTEQHLLKDERAATPQDMMDASIYHGGAPHADALPTSGLASFHDGAYSGRGVMGTFRIPPAELIELARQGKAILGNLSEGEVLLSGDIARKYLTEVNGKPLKEGQDNTSGQDSWQEFAPETGTLAMPRADMPQIKAEHRGAMTNFLNARGITHQQEEVPAADLKPTQAEFSPERVAAARNYEGGDRSILVSSDNHILDGHHQWLAAAEDGKPVKVIRLNAPIADLVQQVKEFPSATMEETADVPERTQVPEEAAPAPRAQGPRQAEEASAADADRDDGADIPLAFYKRVKVQHDVFVEETGQAETVEVPADQALRSVREDKENLQALLKCMKGGA